MTSLETLILVAGMGRSPVSLCSSRQIGRPSKDIVESSFHCDTSEYSYDQFGARILCAGEDATLSASRCAVLSHGGYCADFALLQEAKKRVSERHYEVVILSANMPRAEKDFVMAAAPPAVRLLEIERLTAPQALLASVKHLASQRL